MRALSRIRAAWAGSAWLRVCVSGFAMILVAELAVFVVAPGDGGIDPLTVDPSDWFSADQIERAGDYRAPQIWLFAASLAIQIGVVALMIAARPAPLARLYARLERRPLIGAALIGALVWIVAAIATTPIAWIGHERAVDYGLATQGAGDWLGDRVRSVAISALVAALAALLLVALVRRLPRRWWLVGGFAIAAGGSILAILSPVLIAPSFNDFERLTDGSPLRERVLELGDAAGVEIGEVYRVDASRRSTALNAYVDGLGPTKRVVLYDNLLDEVDRARIETVVAHELGHIAGSDVARGIAFVFIVAPLGMLFAAQVAGLIAARGGFRLGAPRGVPALLLSVWLAAFLLGLVGNQLSRRMESAADAFALDLTADPQAVIGVQRQLAISNLSDPDPGAVRSFLLASHPSTVERIGAALAWEAGER